MESRTCPDCGASAEGRFCPSCGQRLDVDPKSLRYWLRESLEELLSIDGRLLRSLRTLALSPGLLTVEWREGKRSSWTSPFRLYLLASLTFFTASLVLPMEASFSVSVDVIEDPALRDAVQSAQEETLATVAPQVLIALVPVLALILRVGFGGGLFYVEHLVHAVHLQSFLFLVLLLIFLGPHLPASLMPVLIVAILLIPLVYMMRSCLRVYRSGLVRTLLTAAVAAFAYLLIMLIALGAVVTVVTPDPLDALVEAEQYYWELRDDWASGDTASAASRARAVAVRYRRLEAHMLSAEAMAHAAEMLAAGDNVRDGRLMAEQQLLASPGHALLLRVAMDAAVQMGDPSAARGYAERLLDAADPPGLDPRHAPDLGRARQRATRLLNGAPPGG